MTGVTRSGATAAGLLQLMTSGTVNVGIVTGSSNILCHTERIVGFLKTLEPFSDRIRVVDTVEIHDDEVESYEKTTTLLSKHPEINALFFAAGGVYGGCRSVEALGKKKAIRIIAFDLVPTTRQMLAKHFQKHKTNKVKVSSLEELQALARQKMTGEEE